MYERKQNGEVFFSSLCVTYSRFGNYPANGLVTEQPQYSVVVCIFHILQNTEIQLISNDLRLIFTYSLLLASPCIFHTFRHTFATLLLEEGVDIKYIPRQHHQTKSHPSEFSPKKKYADNSTIKSDNYLLSKEHNK